MEENYLLALKSVSERFSKDDKLFYFYVCALYGLLCKFSNHKDIVLNIFNKCDFYLENGSIPEILKRHDINESEFDDGYTADNEFNMTYGISNSGHEFYVDDNDNVSCRIGVPFIACSLDSAPIEQIINIFCHEFSHLVKGEVNGYDSLEDDKRLDYYIRTGLAYFFYSYDKESDELSSSVEFCILDECINTIQTTEIMREIIGLKELCSIDEGLDKFVNSLDTDILLDELGYETVCDIVRRLWENESFRVLIEDKIVTEGVPDIEAFFDSIVGKGKLFELSELLDEAFELTDDSNNQDKIDILKKKALKIVDIFNNNIKKMIKS